MWLVILTLFCFLSSFRKQWFYPYNKKKFFKVPLFLVHLKVFFLKVFIIIMTWTNTRAKQKLLNPVFFCFFFLFLYHWGSKKDFILSISIIILHKYIYICLNWGNNFGVLFFRWDGHKFLSVHSCNMKV